MSRIPSRHVEDGIDVVLMRVVLLRIARVRMECGRDGSITTSVATVCTALMQALMQRRKLIPWVVACRGRHGPAM